MPPLPKALCHECGREVAVRVGGELREHRPLEGYEATCHDTGPCPGSGQVPVELAEVCGIPVHPAASAWPLLPDAELAELAADIKAHGLREPIRMRGALLLDGRNRRLACDLAGVTPHYDRSWAGPDATAYVVSANLHRRHLSASQRSMIAARLLPAERAAAKARQADAGRSAPRGAEPGDATPPAAPSRFGGQEKYDSTAYMAGHLDATAGRPEDPGERDYGAGLEEYRAGYRDGEVRRAEIGRPGRASEHAAEQLGVGARSVERAEQVLERGAPELVAAVDEDRVPVSVAADLSELPPEEQRDLIETASPEVLRQVARDVRDKRREEARRKREEKRAAQAEEVRQASPEVAGVDLRCGRASDMLRELEGAGARLVHADPAWESENDGANGAAAHHYPTMALGEIVDDLELSARAAATNAVLVVWAIWTVLPDLLFEIETRRRAGQWSWGKPYSGGSWHKTGRIATGRLWRGCTEPILLFERGRIATSATIENGWVCERLKRHSEKPEEWLRLWLRAWVPEGGLVLDPYAGLAPMARACARLGRRYVGTELDEARHAEAVAELGRVVPDASQLAIPLTPPAAATVAGVTDVQIVDLVREGLRDEQVVARLSPLQPGLTLGRVRRARQKAGLLEARQGQAVTT